MRKRRGHYAKTGKRRQQIIQAALACFTEMGFLDATIEDIRTRSQASNGSIYHHFRSKEQLAAAVYLEGLFEWQDTLLAELEEHPGALDGVYALVRSHLRWVSQHPDWTRYLFQMRHAGFMAGTEDSIAEQNKRFVEGFGKWLSVHTERGTLRMLPMELFLSIIIGPCLEFSRIWLTKPDCTDMDLAAAEIAKAAWQALSTKKNA